MGITVYAEDSGIRQVETSMSIDRMALPRFEFCLEGYKDSHYPRKEDTVEGSRTPDARYGGS